MAAKNVTLLMTDVEGSTELWERDPAGMQEATDAHERIVAHIVERFEGSLPRDQGEGDSVVLAFDDPNDAVAAALEFQRSIAGASWPHEIRLRVRMGLNTGPCELRGGNYQGTTIIRCARIRGFAHGGQALLSDATARLVKDSLPSGAWLIDLGEHRMKGLAEAERVWQLCHPELERDFPPLRSLGPLGALAQSPVQPAEFVGRAAQLGEVLRRLRDSLTGAGQVLLLVGDPGMGKTRLCEEIAAEARASGMQVLWGRCHEGSGAPALWPWVQVIREAAGCTPEAELNEALGQGSRYLAQIVPELGERTERPGDVPGDPDAARFQLLTAAVTFFRRLAAYRPLVFILEDLHWADKTSLLLLEFLSREITDLPILVIGTYRDVTKGPGAAIAQMTGDVLRRPNAVRVPLPGLDRTDVARLIESMTGVPPRERLVDALHSKSEGNPLFVGEILRLLASEGRLETFSESPDADISLPPGVRDVISRRLSFLSEDCHTTLAAASLLGRRFEVRLLRALLDLPTTSVDASLEEAEGLRVLVPATNYGSYLFAHALIQETLYEDLPLGVRLAMHARAGQVIEKIYEHNLGPHLTQIAHHFSWAGDSEAGKAAHYSALAARQALQRFAYEEAVRLFAAAIEKLAYVDHGGPDEAELLLDLGDAQWRAGHIEQSKQTFVSAAELATSSGATEALARAALGYGGLWIEVGIVDTQLVELLERALSGVGGRPTSLSIRIQARLAMELSYSDQAERRRSLTRSAIESARALKDRESLAYALMADRHAAWGPESLDERLAGIDESIRLAEQTNDSEMLLRGRVLRLIDLFEIGDVRKIDQEQAWLARVADELKLPFYAYLNVLLRAMRALMEGRFEEADDLNQKVFSFAQQMGRRSIFLAASGQLLTLRREQGRLTEMRDLVEGAVAQYPELPAWRSGLAVLYMELDLREEARGEFEFLARDNFGTLPRDSSWLVSTAVLAELCVYLEDVEHASTLFELLMPYADRNVLVGITSPVVWQGSVAHYLGLLATTLTRWDDAERYFDAAASMSKTMRALPWLIRTQQARARLLLARGGPDAKDASLRVLNDADELASRAGLELLVERGRALVTTGERSEDR
ncbi:MAG: AAA family ATPase [Actinomycetota bacterium]|nr:AAA family ATPase [Actinomycetota bacterium]